MNGAVMLASPTPKPPRLSEILRYAGVRNAADGEVVRLAEQCVAAALGDIKSLVCYRVVDIEITHTGVGLGGVFAASSALRRRLVGCRLAVVFAATVGQGLDRRIARAAKRSPAEALMLSEHVLLMKESGYTVLTQEGGYSEIAGTEIRTDAQKLVRIFDNVFSNIYKYADKSRPVSITLLKKEGKIVIGFENYTSLNSNKAESNGIGLKTCKKLGEYIGAEFITSVSEDKFMAYVSLKCTQKE